MRVGDKILVAAEATAAELNRGLERVVYSPFLIARLSTRQIRYSNGYAIRGRVRKCDEGATWTRELEGPRVEAMKAALAL